MDIQIFRSLLQNMIQIMDKRLNDHGKNWRHVYKTLILLEYMICCGSESVVQYAKDRLYMIGTLKEFRHIDAQGYDQGGNVRAKSRDIVDLLSDEALLLQARAQRSVPQLRRRTSQEPLTITNGSSRSLGASQSEVPRRRASYEDLQQMDEDAAMALALRDSQEMHAKELARRNSGVVSVEPSQVYPNFLDNVSRASLARSNSSGNALQTSQEQQQQKKSMEGSLLDLDDDEEFTVNPQQQQRSQSFAISELNGFYAPMQNQAQHNPNPFVTIHNEANPFDTTGIDPFANVNPVQQQRAQSLSDRLPVPVPMAPGQAPVNHMSVVGGNNVGAKPVMPHQMAPQFGYQSNQAQDGPKHDSGDPFF